MRPVGFSTGAVALGSFSEGLKILAAKGVQSVELSALRFHELRPLVDALDHLDLSMFAYISFHAPSDFTADNESEVLMLLKRVAARGLSIVVHPDSIHNWSAWLDLGASVLLENMDKRKSTGRTCAELSKCFEQLPSARFCFDLGHARQVDPSLVEARRILEQFGSRMAQIHISEVSSGSTHERISWPAAVAFASLSKHIPRGIPVIVESVVHASQVTNEIERARSSLGEGEFPGVVGVLGAA